MDMESWAELARLAREAKAELEATEPEAEGEIGTCDEVIALAEARLLDGTWTADSDVLAEWLDAAKSIAVAVRNGYVADEPIPPDGGDERNAILTTWHEADGGVYLPLDGADEPELILTNWLAKAPEGVRREAQVKYGTNETDTAFVMLRERPTDPASDD